MPKRDSPMNLVVAPVAVRLGKTMIEEIVVTEVVAVVVLRAKELFIMPYVLVAEPKLKFPSNRNRIGKFCAGIASAPRTVTDSFSFIITDKRHGQSHGVFYYSITN
jgi:hypothetical protein